MVSPADYEGLVEAVYESAVDPAGWSPFLDRLAKAFSASIVGFVHQDIATKHDAVALIKGVDETAAREYEAHWAARNVWIAGAAERIVEGITLTGQMMCPDEVLRKSDIWNDFCRKWDAFHLVGGCILKTGTATSNFTIIRSERLGPYEESDLSVAERLMPHLQRAVRIHRRLAHLERGTPIAGVADRLPEAFFLLDAAGRVLFANRAAERILAVRDGLRADDSGLRAATSEATRRLRALACRGDGVLRLPRPSGRRPLVALASPIPAAQTGAWIAGPRPHSVVFVRDPEAGPVTCEQQLQEAYGLTPTEARVAAALAGGEALSDIAAAQQVTVNTLRTHLRRIYDKTDTHRQAELVRLVLATAGALRPPQG